MSALLLRCWFYPRPPVVCFTPQVWVLLPSVGFTPKLWVLLLGVGFTPRRGFYSPGVGFTPPVWVLLLGVVFAPHRGYYSPVWVLLPGVDFTPQMWGLLPAVGFTPRCGFYSAGVGSQLALGDSSRSGHGGGDPTGQPAPAPLHCTPAANQRPRRSGGGSAGTAGTRECCYGGETLVTDHVDLLVLLPTQVSFLLYGIRQLLGEYQPLLVY